MKSNDDCVNLFMQILLQCCKQKLDQYSIQAVTQKLICWDRRVSTHMATEGNSNFAFLNVLIILR